MSNKNEKTKEKPPQNPPPGEIGDSAGNDRPTNSKKEFSNSMFTTFKHLLPALREAFAAGIKTFKTRAKGVPVSGQSPSEDGQQKESRPEPDKSETESKQSSLPQQPAGGFQSLPVTGSKQRKFITAFLIALIIIIPVCGGLYLGGIFDENGNPATVQGDSHQKSAPDSASGTKNPGQTPEKQLAAMHIALNPNNFVKYAGQNDINVVNLFIKSGMAPDTHRPLDGFTPLMAAAAFDRQDMAEFLLNVNGTDINAKDNDGQTALMKAVKHNRPNIVKLLLGKKADYNIADNQGNTALTLANEDGNTLLTETFANFGVDISTAKKESAARKSLEAALPNSTKAPALTSDAPPSSDSSQPKRPQYPEISVQEFLKLLEPKPAPESKSEPTPAHAPN